MTITGEMRLRRIRLSLLGKFSLVSLGLILALAFGLASLLKAQIEQRALRNAEELAQAVAQVEVAPRLSLRDLDQPLSKARLAQLDRELGGSALRDNGVVRVKLFNRRSRLAYSDDHALIGDDARASDGVAHALAGRVESEVEHGVADDGTGIQVLEVYSPLRLRGEDSLDGAFELYVSYDLVAAYIKRDTRTMYALLAVGFALLYGLLFRLVAGASRRLRQLALHDALTGLPNRTLFGERVERGLSGLPAGRQAAVLLIDLDRFKEVNDTLGHDHGDALLCEVSERLRGALREGDTLARLGGDEFAVLLAELPNRSAAVELAGRLQDALRRPFALRGLAVELEASIGIALCPEHGSSVTTLVQHADVAMYEAKRTQNPIRTYSADRDPHSPDRLGLLSELRRAVEGDELVLHYQPKVSLAENRVTGVEALVRWQHPQRGLLPPDEFVPLAERTGTIAHLTRWVLDEALRQCAEWREQGVELPVAVNLAAANLVDADLSELIAQLLAKHGLAGRWLEVEVSERTVMSDPQRVLDVLADLRELGVRLSLDDFGTGHSSLAYLKRLPLDEVKIDRSFVTGMAEDSDDAAIVRSTIDLARNLGLDVVAEGVETREVLDELSELNCDVAQGFFLSRPIPADALVAWLNARESLSPSA